MGIAVSVNENVSTWIFTVAAGMFIYIALADMVITITQYRIVLCKVCVATLILAILRNFYFHNFFLGKISFL